MATRAVIARTTDGINFKGTYHHWDGYPTGLGVRLFELLKGRFKNNVGRMLTFIIDTHSGGWSTLNPSSETNKMECYCHPKRKRAAETGNNNWDREIVFGRDSDGYRSGIEWVYAFDEANRTLYVMDVYHEVTTKVSLDSEPNWEVMECGENFERCSHYAWKHFPEMLGSNLSTRTYLGYDAPDFHDIIAVTYQGKTYKTTGSGFSASYRRSERIIGPVDSNGWIAMVKARNGRTMYLQTAIVRDGEYLTPAGIEWIVPATKIAPQKTIVVRNIARSKTVPSETVPGKTYTVAVDEVGKRTCTCMDYKFRGQDCKHLYSI